jgi:hypothetical protein
MPWARFDDRYPSNRKVRPLSDAAFRLDVSAVCWSNENLTDGRIRGDELTLVADIRNHPKAAEELVLRGRWLKTEDGWEIHDFLVYNPSRDQVLADRAKAAERQRRAREASKAKRDAARDAALDIEIGHAGSNGSSHGGVTS